MSIPPRSAAPRGDRKVREVRIHGAVTVDDLHLLRDHLDDVLLQDPDRVVVDLSTCPRLAPEALAVLRAAEQRLRPTGGVLELRGADAPTRELLDRDGLLALVELSDAKPGARPMPAR